MPFKSDDPMLMMDALVNLRFDVVSSYTLLWATFPTLLIYTICFQATKFSVNEESFEANIRDYTKLLDGYAKKDRLEDAERVFKTMTDKGFSRDAVTCNVLIHMYSKTGNLDRAREAFDQMRTLGLQQDQSAYGSMIMACV